MAFKMAQQYLNQETEKNIKRELLILPSQNDEALITTNIMSLSFRRE